LEWYSLEAKFLGKKFLGKKFLGMTFLGINFLVALYSQKLHYNII
jgi:hypothetical protein